MNKEPKTQGKIHSLIVKGITTEMSWNEVVEAIAKEQQALLQRVIELIEKNKKTPVSRKDKGVSHDAFVHQIGSVEGYNQALDDVITKISQMSEEL